MIVIVMGVSGTGKSTVGKALAADLDCGFIDGDDYHPDENVEKMRAGVPLTDEDRHPWLARLHVEIVRHLAVGEGAVVACSALKADYRDRLRGKLPDVHFVYLQGEAELIRMRMREREDHFMPPDLLTSQIETLEPPDDAVLVPIELPIEEQVRLIRGALPEEPRG